MSLEPKDCRWPWNRLYVQVDGEIKPCCYSMFSLGNAETSTDLDAVWNGKQMTGLRAAIGRNEIHPLCAGAGCAYVRSQIPDAVMASAKHRVLIPEDVMDPVTRQLAQLGNRQAALNIGYAYKSRPSETKFGQFRNQLNSIIWRERSVRAGHIVGAYALGHEYRFGPLKPILGWRGIRLLKRACQHQYPAAFASLGYHYHQSKQYHHALKTFQEGVELNDPDSMYWLSQYYEFGIILEKDVDESNRLRDLALRRGSKDARSAQIIKQKQFVPTAS
jgi:hypothetical protein